MTDKKQAGVTDKKQAGVTDKKIGRSDRRGKTPWYVEEGKRRAVTGKREIRRFLDVFLRKRGMTGIRKEREMTERGRGGCDRRMS